MTLFRRTYFSTLFQVPGSLNVLLGILYRVVFNYLDDMITNAIEPEVNAWNSSQQLALAKFIPRKTRNNFYLVPARMRFYRRSTAESVDNNRSENYLTLQHDFAEEYLK